MKNRVISNDDLRSLIKEAIGSALSYDIVDYMKDSSDWSYIKKNKVRIWDFLNDGYEFVGYDKFCGCDNVKSLLKNANLVKIAFYDGEWVAVAVYTGYRGGYKCVGITATTDMGLWNIGKDAVNDIVRNDVCQFSEFYWTECSGTLERLYEKHNGIKIPNEYAFSILQRPVTLLKDGYHYEREIKGETQQKVIYGFNNKETFETVKREYTAYINDCIQKIVNCQINEDVEVPSFGRLSKTQCSIAVVNFFVDLRWEDECYELSLDAYKILMQHVNYLKRISNNHQRDEQLELAISNGKDLLRTMSLMKFTKF